MLMRTVGGWVGCWAVGWIVGGPLTTRMMLMRRTVGGVAWMMAWQVAPADGEEGGAEDDDDDEEEPVYNPKNLPLGYDDEAHQNAHYTSVVVTTTPPTAM